MLGMFRRRTPQLQLVALDSRGSVEVVGEASYIETLRKIAGKPKDYVRIEKQAVLQLDTKNKHDSNAVSVSIDDQLVGYLSRSDAADYRPALLLLAERNLAGTCTAWVVGGGNEKPNLGVFLDLGSPKRVMSAVAKGL
jgi:hypothetical protein